MGILSDRQLTREVIEAGRIKNFDPHPDNKGRISAGLSSFGIDVRVGYQFSVFDVMAHGGVIDPKNFDSEKILRKYDITPPPAPDITPPADADRLKTWYGPDNSVWEFYSNDGWSQIGLLGPIERPPDHIVLPPHSFALAETIEELTIPRDCLVLALSKSTLLRCGLYNSTSVLEPMWTGTITLELTNLTPLPMKVYAGEGIAQLIFLRSDERLETLMDALSFENDTLRQRWQEILSASCGKSYADKSGKYQGQSGITPPKV